MPTLTAPQTKTLAAIADTLVPPDENGPGGVEAGVPAYIEKVLAGNDEMRGLYDANLAALDQLCEERFGAPFADLEPEQRADALRAVESGEAGEAFVPDAAVFFAILHHNMLEGLFGDPQYGGNVEFAGWRLIGYRGVKLEQTAEDQRLGPPPDRPLTSRLDAIRTEAGSL
jgi:gluconate 2-dehydrogenase gamma chain